MNGRIYDPLLGRFLSADLVVDGPGDLQGYNRYSYVKNRPLSAVDPTGWDSMALLGIGGPGMGFYAKGNNVDIAFTAQKAGYDAAHEAGKSEFNENVRQQAKGAVIGLAVVTAPVVAAELGAAAVVTLGVDGLAATGVTAGVDALVFGGTAAARTAATNVIEGKPAGEGVADAAVKEGATAAAGGIVARGITKLIANDVKAGASSEISEDTWQTQPEQQHQGKAYSRNMQERQKALLRDAADPDSGLSDQARQSIVDSKGKSVPKDYEVSHETPLYTKPPKERAALDKAENMKTQPKPEHRARHKRGGDQYNKYGPPSDYDHD